MDTIRLRFCRNRTIVSSIVCFLTRSKFSHVDYIFDDGRAYSSLPNTGVNFNNDRNDVVEWYEMDVWSKYKFEEFLLSQRYKPYDFGAIGGFVFDRVWDYPDRWFCSELIAAAATYAGTPLYNEEDNRITPRDLYIHPLIRRIQT